MIDLEMIRTRCDELLQAAMESGDKKRIERLLLCKEKFAEEDCFSEEKQRQNWRHMVFNLEFSHEEIEEFREYLENRTKVKGLLYTIGSDGREYPEEVILDPKNEGYYQFKHGPVCKKRFTGGGFYDTYVLFDGRWVYDGSLERKFEDTGYEYIDLRCELPNT